MENFGQSNLLNEEEKKAMNFFFIFIHDGFRMMMIEVINRSDVIQRLMEKNQIRYLKIEVRCYQNNCSSMSN